MPPFIALSLWLVCLLLLLYFDPAKSPDVSVALWLPLAWMFIVGSRLPSQWLGGQVGQVATALQEGNPIDRTIYFGLILLALGVLAARSFQWSAFFANNVALTIFLAYALVSFVWSDFPLISFKRWFRDLGNYLVILIALSDPHPMEAVRTLLRRLAYLLIPLSILLVKYFPEIGRAYDPWHGTAIYSGAATSKNMLGALCLVSALYFFWDTTTRWPERRDRRTQRVILVNVTFIVMTLWLLNLAQSTTSVVCLILGWGVVVATRSSFFKRRSGAIKTLVPLGFCIYLVFSVGFGLSGEMANAVGKDPTLTDRTGIWEVLLNMQKDPILGTGYETFWLGPRLNQFWESFPGLNEAHNGYLEVYLNLGIAGLACLAAFLIASYRTTCRRLSANDAFAPLGLAIWAVMLFYNVTEAGFRASLIWLSLLLTTMEISEAAKEPVNLAAPPNWGEFLDAHSPFRQQVS